MFRHCLVLLWFLTAMLSGALVLAQNPPKDQSKLPLSEDQQSVQQTPLPEPQQPAPTPPAETPQGEDLTAPDAEGGAAGEQDSMPDEISLGEIPVIITIELTEDLAKRAVDAFAVVKDKYGDANLEEYENLQDFVEQTPEGKQFEADIKSYGFANVTEWNTAITTVGFAYSAMTDDQSHEILLQIEEIKKDNSLAQDMKDRMISSLSAMIPSDNNRKVVEALSADPNYEEKLKLLAEEE